MKINKKHNEQAMRQVTGPLLKQEYLRVNLKS